MLAPRPVRCRFANTAATTPSSIGAIAFSLVFSYFVREAKWRPATWIARSGRNMARFARRKPASGGIEANVAAATWWQHPLCPKAQRNR